MQATVSVECLAEISSVTDIVVSAVVRASAGGQMDGDFMIGNTSPLSSESKDAGESERLFLVYFGSGRPKYSGDVVGSVAYRVSVSSDFPLISSSE